MSKNLKLIAAATDAQLGPADNKPARKGSVEERMYHEIYDAIMEHRLPPRTKLTSNVVPPVSAIIAVSAPLSAWA